MLLDTIYFDRNPVRFLRKRGMKIGDGCRILCGLASFGSEPFLITLGNHVTITGSVTFITHDGGVWIFREAEPDIDFFGSITIGNNVFIGMRSIILPNVSIGDNSVIGAGSVVARSIPPNSIAAGTPARVLKSASEYRKKIALGETHIRNLPPSEKERILRQRFGLLNH